RVRSWTVLPDHASVNWHEAGAEELAAALIERGVGVEAGIWSGTDGAARFVASPLGPRVLRVLAEVTDTSAETAEASARALLADLGPAFGRPVLLHGEDGGTWPVLRLAGRLGLATRIGLEDTLTLPNGERAVSNARLVAEGLVQYGRLP
ncbi:3-keto-5-aminohexanoate cleavage protein, partial [Streptomyces sp. Lzd4kr]|nr:3-keto-5-aminohexanoate cleavage protein [Streptomyces sp. Lzd4kr]